LWDAVSASILADASYHYQYNAFQSPPLKKKKQGKRRNGGQTSAAA